MKPYGFPTHVKCACLSFLENTPMPVDENKIENASEKHAVYDQPNECRLVEFHHQLIYLGRST